MERAAVPGMIREQRLNQWIEDYVYLYTQEFFGLSNQEMVQYFGAGQSIE